MRRRIRIALGLVALFTVGALWVAASFGEAALERLTRRAVADRFGDQATFGGIEVSWIPPSIRFRDVVLRNPTGELRVRVAEGTVTLATWASLWEGTWIADLAMHDPEVVWRDEDPFWRSLLGDSSASGSAREPSFLPRRLAIRSGRVRWALSGTELEGQLEEVQIDGELGGLLAPEVSFEAAATGWLERAGRRFAFERLAVRGQVSPRGVGVEELLLEADGDRLAGSGRWARGELEGNLRWEGQLDPVFALVPEAGEIRGGAAIVAEVTGTLEEPVVDAQLEAREVWIDDVEFSGKGELSSRGDDWRLTSASVKIFGGTVEAEASGRWAGGIPYVVNGRFEGWHPPTFLGLFDADWPVIGAWSGRARLSGRLLGDDLEGSGSFDLVSGEQQVGGKASFEVSASSAEIEGAIGDASTGTLAVRYAVRRDEISGDATLAGERLSPLLAFVGFSRLDGAGEVRGRFEGTRQDPAFRGTIDLGAVRVGTGALGRVRGGFSLTSRAIRSDGIEGFDGRLRASGNLPLSGEVEGAWQIALLGLPLREASAALRVAWEEMPETEVSGTIDGALSGTGGLWEPRLSGKVEVSGLRLAGEGPLDFRGSLGGGADDWHLEGVLAAAEGIRVTLNLAAREDGSLSGRIDSTGGRLEALAFVRERWPSLQGGLRLEGVAGGTVRRPQAEGRILLHDLKAGGEESLADAALELRLRERELEIQAASGELWTLTASARMEAGLPFAAEARCRDLDLQPLFAPGSDLAIRVSGAGRLRGNLVEPLDAGEARLGKVEIERGSVRVTNVEPLEVAVRNGTVTLAPVTLRDTDQELLFEGTFGRGRSAMRAKGRGDLRLLETLLPGVASARGAVDLEVRGNRTGQGPWHLFGSASLQDAAMDLGFLVGITEVSGDVRFDGDRAEIPGFTGRLGGGEFLVAGNVARDRGWDLGWAIRDANLAVPAWLDYRASGNGRFSGPLVGPRFSGEIEIVQALYDRPVEWAEFLPWFRREAKRSGTPAGVPIELDLRIFSDGGLYVDNNLVEAELESRFEVRGAGGEVRWKGRLDVVSGEFVFRRRRFVITAGSVQFHERRPLNPDLEFRGETTVSTGESDYEILVQVTGTAERPRVEFLADDPALSENDILALVTFGRTVSQLQAQGAGIELSEVLALTAGPRADAVEERIYEFIPVDRIEIQPTFSRTSGTTEPRLSIGKDLTPELRALLSTGLGAERQQDVALEYQLTPRISVQGAWESQTKSQTGAFGGDLKFRFPFRTFRDLSLLPAGDPDQP